MRSLFIASLLFLLQLVCPGQCNKEDIAPIKALMDDALGYGLGLVKQRHPMVITYSAQRPIAAVTDSAVGMALDSTIEKTSGPYSIANGRCAYVRIHRKWMDEWARVSYIFVTNEVDTEGSAEARADSILLLIRNGLPFRSAAILCSTAGDISQNEGDLGWFTMSSQMPEFQQAIRNHRKHDVYKVYVAAYGWYIVMVTEEPRTCLGVAYSVATGPFHK